MIFDSIKRRILIVGGTSGIGFGLVHRLKDTCELIVVVGRNKENITNLGVSKAQIIFIEFDLKNFSKIDFLLTQIGPEKFDGVIYTAGFNELKPLKFITAQNLLDVYSVNLFSFQLIISNLFKKKMLMEGSSIVALSSIASSLNEPAAMIYSSSKAALNSTIKTMAKELSKNSIRVNALLPGAIPSEMNTRLGFTLDSNKNIFESYMGLGAIEDIVNQIIMLISDLSNWQTGSLIVIDGGQSL